MRGSGFYPFSTGRQISSAVREAALAAGLLSASFAMAGPADSAFSVHGFGTVGAVRTTSDQVEFVRDLSQPRGARTEWDGKVDSLLGVQANWRINPRLEAVVQGVSRYRYDRSFTPDISWAYLKYEPTPDITLRGGRLGTDFFMAADSRLVGYSFLTVRPPGDFFWHLPFYTIVGGDAQATVSLGQGLMRGKIFYGISEGKVPLADKQWKIDGSPMSGAYVDYRIGQWQFRLGYANITFARDLPVDDVLQAYLPSAAVAGSKAWLSTRQARTDYYSFGIVYDSGPWQVQLMLNQVEQGNRAIEPSHAGYLLAGYRVGDVTPYAGYSWSRSRRRGQGPNGVVDTIVADSHVAQATSFLGARWDFYRNVAMKAQWDAIRGEPASIFPFRREQAGWNGRLDVFSLTMDFVF